MTATKIQPGDDTHLTLLMAPHSLNFVTGADRAALLAYGRDVFAAGRETQCLAQIQEPSQPVAEICSASGDGAEFGERSIKLLRDISGFEYGTPLYAGAIPTSTVDDMAALVKQLVQALHKAAPNHVLPAKALDYLRRQGLLGSPLRSAAAIGAQPSAQGV